VKGLRELALSGRRVALRLWRTPRSRAEVRRMERSGDARLQAVAAAIRAVVEDRAAPEEAKWFERIEALRARTNARTDAVDWRLFEGSEPDASGEYPSRLIPRAVGEVAVVGSKRPKWARLLFHVLRRLDASSCLELGTCVGISGAYQAAALACNGGGRLVSLEGSESLVDVAKENWAELGLSAYAEAFPGHFGATLPGALERGGPFDYVFVDGHHDGDATWEYYRAVLPHLKEGAVIAFDDINWSPGMRRAWDRIRRDGDVGAAVDLLHIGLVLVGGDGTPRQFRLTI
jgi:predicted O-methyltransferase YrrM